MNGGMIRLSVSNINESEKAVNKRMQNPVEVRLLGESKSGRHFVCELGAYYAVFEKSSDDDLDGTVCCSFVGCRSMGSEAEDGIVRETLWREDCGCVKILYYDWLVEGSGSVCVVWDEELYEAKERRFRTANTNPQFIARKKKARSFLGEMVKIRIDRPIGVHRKEGYTLTYPINYGFIPDVIGGDGEELDVYLLGVSEPVESFEAKVIGIVHREDDNEDKLVAVPDGISFTKKEIAEQIKFQEQYYNSFIETEDSFYECSMCDCAFDRKIPAELEHLLLNKTVSYFRNNTFGVYSNAEFKKYLTAFKDAGKSEEYVRQICEKSEIIANPRTLFVALWREYRRQGDAIAYDESVNLKFRFSDGGLMIDVSRK